VLVTCFRGVRPHERDLAKQAPAGHGAGLRCPDLDLHRTFFFSCTTAGAELKLSWQITACEPALLAHARAIRAGEIKTIGERSLLYPVPDLPPYGPSIQHVTMDKNGNVFFVTYSDVFMDDGFLFRNGDAKVLGSGMEPHVEVFHLFGDWWMFAA
jgi:hypothetical protein